MCIHLLEYTHSASICKRTAECSAVSRMCLYAAVSSAGRFSGTESRGLCPAAPEVVYWILKQVQDDVRARHSGLAPESRGLVFPSFRARPGIQGFGVFPSFRARPGIQWSCLSVIPGSPRNPGFWCPASPEVVYWILDQVQDDGGGFGMTSAHVIPGSPRNPEVVPFRHSGLAPESRGLVSFRHSGLAPESRGLVSGCAGGCLLDSWSSQE